MFSSSRYSYNGSNYGDCLASSLTLNVPLSPAASERNPFLDVPVQSVVPSRSHENGSGVQASTIPIHIPASKDCTPQPLPVIQNIVSTCSVGIQLNLLKIAQHSRNAEYNPKRFSAVVMRIRDPRTTALIFSSGKLVVTGAKSEEASKLAARRYARIIQKLNFAVTFSDFKIQNLVGSVDVRFGIHLEALCITHSQFSCYEPELFPGLVYRMMKPRVVLLIFGSGKVVLTGAKTRDEINEAFDQIYPILQGFKK